MKVTIMRNRGFLKNSCLVTSLVLCLAVPAIGGEESWRATFDDLCAQSNEAMALSVGELNTLIDKCNKLQKVIETEDETVRKVYLKRLQLCKNLYVFVLETKMNEQQKK
jgi:hypothetical protein